MGNSASTMRHDETAILVAGQPVRCYRAGAGVGPTLVLLHGGGLDSAQAAWASVWSALTSHARLVAPDLPGFGGSPLGTTTPTLRGYRTWLLGFLDACHIGRAILAGLALGSGIALRTALDAPGRVAGLVLLAPLGVSPSELDGISCPALLLAGARDRLVPAGDLRAAAEQIPDGRFVLVPGAGHQLPREAPGQIADELVACLTGTSAAEHR